ncbi:MAG: hypothetical protein QOI47_1129 [Actinomycetota bacterium]|nr:hypothetical protein [Actinomycetota bacterium]
MAGTRSTGRSSVAAWRTWLRVGSAFLVVASGLTLVVGAPVTPAGAATVNDPVVVAAGDIACAPNDPNFSGANTASCQMAATANTVVGLAPSYVLPIGDTQYVLSQTQGTEPTLQNYQAGYGASWAKISTRVAGVSVRPVPGNHEYGDLSETSQPPIATGDTYYSYFGPNGLGYLPSTVTSSANDWYSYDIPVSGGRWHVVALDSECAVLPTGGAASGCASGSPMETWLANDLAAHPNTCTAVYWHQPRWAWGSSGSDARFDALWRDLVRFGVTLSVHGHDHFYQHFGPMDAAGNPSPTGVSEFIVGSGGIDHESAGPAPVPAAVVAQNDTEFGVLALTLHASSASYAFRTTAGATRDSGSLACTAAPPTPKVTAVTPTYGPAAGGTQTTITGTGFGSGATVSFGGVAASAVTVQSSTSILATAPAGTRTVDVRVTTASGTSPVVVQDEFTNTYSSNGTTASLSATTTTPGLGVAVTLSASTSKNLPKNGVLSIVDAATGAVVAQTASGTTTSASVSQTAASTHRYVAQVDNGKGGALQAVSVPVVVTWASNTPRPTVTAVTPISGPSSGGTQTTITGTGFAPGATVSFADRPATAVTVQSATSILATAPADTRTVDVTVTVSGATSAINANDEFTNTYATNGWTASLAATTTTPAVGANVTLTATANQDLGPSNYGMSIVDVTTNTVLVHIGTGTTATASVTQTAASTHRYVAQVDSINGLPTQAVSTPIVVTWR